MPEALRQPELFDDSPQIMLLFDCPCGVYRDYSERREGVLDTVWRPWQWVTRRAWPFHVAGCNAGRNEPVVSSSIGRRLPSSARAGGRKLDLYPILKGYPIEIIIAGALHYRNRPFLQFALMLVPTPNEWVFRGIDSDLRSGRRLERHSLAITVNLLHLKQGLRAILQHVVIVDDLNPVVRAQAESTFVAKMTEGNDFTLAFDDWEYHRAVFAG